MKYRLLGRTGVFVSAVSLGTMTLGGAGHPIWGQFGAIDQAGVTSVILGARTTDQLSANIAATELKLTERDRLSSAR
jgi:aryl-alcohol dehydrogenase-like predicted oxidoreductase